MADDEATRQALLQIFDRLGRLDGRLEGVEDRLDAGSRKHEEFSRELKTINKTIAPLPAIEKTVEGMKPIVDDYDSARKKTAGAMIVLGGAVAGLTFFGTEIKAVVLRKLGLN